LQLRENAGKLFTISKFLLCLFIGNTYTKLSTLQYVGFSREEQRRFDPRMTTSLNQYNNTGLNASQTLVDRGIYHVAETVEGGHLGDIAFRSNFGVEEDGTVDVTIGENVGWSYRNVPLNRL